MTDLSALSLVPQDDETVSASGERARGEVFAWPTPPYAIYPSAEPQHEHEPCEIE